MRSKWKTEWFGADESFSSPSQQRLTQNRYTVQSPGKPKSPRIHECWFLEGCVLICVWPSQLLIGMALQNSNVPPTPFSFQNPILQAEQLPSGLPLTAETWCLSPSISQPCYSISLPFMLLSFSGRWGPATIHQGLYSSLWIKSQPWGQLLFDRVRRWALTPDLRNLF